MLHQIGRLCHSFLLHLKLRLCLPGKVVITRTDEPSIDRETQGLFYFFLGRENMMSFIWATKGSQDNGILRIHRHRRQKSPASQAQ